MRLTARDGIATLFVVAAAVMFALWGTGAAMAGMSVRVMTLVVFALGFAACLTDQRQMGVVYGAGKRSKAAPLNYVLASSAIGGLALVAGIIAMVTGSAVMLATLLAAVVALWLLATAWHALARPA